MRAVLTSIHKTSSKDGLRPLQAKFDGLTWGIVGASLIGHIGGMVQGYPLLNMMMYGDTLTYIMAMGLGVALVGAIFVVVLVGYKRNDEDHADLDFEDDFRPHRRRRRRYRHGY